MSKRSALTLFHSEDVVRHPVVARIVNAYEAGRAEQKRKAALAAERKREEQEQK